MKLRDCNINKVILNNLTVEDLINIYKSSGSSEILRIIVEKTKKLAYRVAAGFKSDRQDIKEMNQVALTGLVIAVNRFDDKEGTKFSTFAIYYIRGEILHFLRDSRLIKTPRWLWKLNKMFTDFVKKYEAENNRYPTIGEISKGINISIEGVGEFLKAREAAFYNSVRDDSIDTGENIKKTEEIYNRSLIRSKEYKSFDLVMEDKIILWDAIDKLKSLNKKILVLSYFLGFSQEEIGKKIGISQKSVSRKLKESIKQLKGYFVCD